MDFFSRTDEVRSLDSIGVTYNEDISIGDGSPTSTSPHVVNLVNRASSSGGAEEAAASWWNNTTASEREHYRYASTDGPPLSAATLSMSNWFRHHRESSIGTFNFSGHPADVVQFRSCVSPSTLHGASVRRRAQRRSRFAPVAGEGKGVEDDEFEDEAPRQAGPFSADVFNIILLFVDVSSPATIAEIGRTCRFWRYYSNYAPHWTFFRRREWNRRKVDLPKYIRAIVMKPKIVTREEYFAERNKVEECGRRDRLIGTAKHLRWCLAIAIMVGAMITANYVIAYFLGFLRTALRSDVNLAITTFVLMVVMTFLELTVVIIPLGVSSPSNRDGVIRILSWGLLLIGVSIVFGIISALAFTRVQATGHVLDGPSMDFASDAPCRVYSSQELPSFALLPALLSDLRWRPLTMDKDEKELQPYCMKRANDERGDSRQCYILLYFDANYSAAVFQSGSALRAGKDVGTHTVNGFNPLDPSAKPQPEMWCAASPYPQVVALTTLMYEDVRAARDARFPSDESWLDPALRPAPEQGGGGGGGAPAVSISHRCSSDINREATENPRRSSDMWYEHSPAWTRYYVPLVTSYLQVRDTFQAAHDHFLRCAFVCYFITAGLWVLMLLGQSIFKRAAISVLGVTTTITLLALNPITLIIAGALCVHVDDAYFMCSPESGGSMIGGGVALFFLLVTIYVSVAG